MNKTLLSISIYQQLIIVTNKLLYSCSTDEVTLNMQCHADLADFYTKLLKI